MTKKLTEHERLLISAFCEEDCHKCPLNDDGHCTKDKKARSKIKNLVERAIPKKVIYLGTCYMPESYEVDYVTFKCPICGEIYYVYDNEEVPYCYKCGQALDWSDE